MDQSEILKFEQQQQITKLSQAIRIGAKLRPQTHLWSDGVGSCALTAAAEATGYDYGDGFGHYSFTIHPHLRKQFPSVPETVLEKVSEWNCSMSRERVADRLEAMGY